MTTDDRCTWSDLPTRDCDHCHPGPRWPNSSTRPQARPARAARLRVAHPVALQTAEVQAHAIPTAVVVHEAPLTTHDYVLRLTEATTHDEPYTIQHTNGDGSHTFVTQRHRTSSPSLLEQLGSSIEPMHSDGDGMRVFASKTPARMEAIDAVLRIEHEVDQLLQQLHLPRTDADDLATMVRRVAAHQGEDLRRQARGWWILAKTVTGWDSPSFRPDNTCPLCGVKGGLRVRVDALTAVCVECGEGWDNTTIQLLGNHIRMENDDLEDDAPEEVEPRRA